MPRATRKVTLREEVSTIEYVNITDRPGFRREIMFFTLSDGRAEKILPGESIFLTQEEVDYYMSKKDTRFKEGLRRKDVEDSQIIKVRDDMSEMEVEIIVRDANELQPFAVRLSHINSIPTLRLFKSYIEKFDKPLSFYNCVMKRIEKLESNRRKKIDSTIAN